MQAARLPAIRTLAWQIDPLHYYVRLLARCPAVHRDNEQGATGNERLRRCCRDYHDAMCNAGGEDMGAETGQVLCDAKLSSPLGCLHALIKQRTAALGICADSSSNGTGWED